MKPILVIGSLNADLVVRAPRFPEPGETLTGEDLQVIPGGKGANQAVAAARMGAAVHMAGRVGKDAFGPMLVDNLKSAGVDVSRVQLNASATGTATIVVDGRGENFIVLSPGANGQVSVADVDAIDFNQFGWLLLQLEIPLDVVSRAAARARMAGCKVIFNPAPAHDLPPNMLAHVDIIIPNETELSLLTGCDTDDLAGVEDCARGLLMRGVETVLVTLGAQGSLLVTAEKTERIPAFKVDVVDTTGAGDAFIGGLAASLAAGKTLSAAARIANACGALAASRFGAQPSLPTLAEVQKLLQE